MAKYLRKISLKKKKEKFISVHVSEVSVHGYLALILWACYGKVHHGDGIVFWKKGIECWKKAAHFMAAGKPRKTSEKRQEFQYLLQGPSDFPLELLPQGSTTSSTMGWPPSL
jgi:hypothetical protein